MNFIDVIYSNLLLILKLVTFTLAVVYRVYSYKSNKDSHSIISDVYTAALFIILAISSVCYKVKSADPKTITIHDTILTHGPDATEVIPAHNPHWNDVPEGTNKK